MSNAGASEVRAITHHYRARDSVLARARDSALAIARELEFARDRAHELEAALDQTRLNRAREIVGDLAAHLDLVRDLVCEIGPVRGLDLDLDLVRSLDHDLDLNSARGVVVVLERAGAQARKIVVELGAVAALDGVLAKGQVRTAACAGWLVRVALRILPAAERTRYGEEWRGELWDLAEGSARRRRQTHHAMRLVVRAWPVRYGIREGQHRPPGKG